MATPPPPGPTQHGQNPYGQNPYGQQQQYGQNSQIQYAPSPQGQNPFGQNPYGQQQQQYGQQPGPAADFGGGPGCTLCGGYPAVPATVRGHQGLLVMMRFLKRRGNFCRDCGIATHREMTTKTLWQGWWGFLSFAITPITLLINLGARGKFNKLPPPTGGARPPLDRGKPIFARAGAYGIVVPVVVLAALIAVASQPDHSAHTASAGDCVSKSGSDYDPTIKVTDCTSPDAAYKVVQKISGKHDGDACDDQYSEYDESGAGNDFALCLSPLK